MIFQISFNYYIYHLLNIIINLEDDNYNYPNL